MYLSYQSNKIVLRLLSKNAFVNGTNQLKIVLGEKLNFPEKNF